MKYLSYHADTVFTWSHLGATALVAVLVVSIRDQTRPQKYRNLFFTFFVAATIALAGLYSLTLCLILYSLLTGLAFILWRRAVHEERQNTIGESGMNDLAARNPMIGELLPASDPRPLSGVRVINGS